MRLQRRILALILFLMIIPGARADYSWPTETLSFTALQPKSALEIQNAQGRVVSYWVRSKMLLYRPLSEISPELTQYLVWLEDAKFWSHDGFDVEEIKKAVSANIESGRIKRGGSTISQQLVKNMFLDKKKTFSRKLFEIPWTLRVERDLGKKQILDLYLNIIEWGPGLYGAELAARHFFNKTAKELAPVEAIYLALIVPNPKRFDLFAHPKAEDFLMKKKATFLKRLFEEKKISSEVRDQLTAQKFPLRDIHTTEPRFPLVQDVTYAGTPNFANTLDGIAVANLKKRLKGKIPAGSVYRLPLQADEL